MVWCCEVDSKWDLWTRGEVLLDARQLGDALAVRDKRRIGGEQLVDFHERAELEQIAGEGPRMLAARNLAWNIMEHNILNKSSASDRGPFCDNWKYFYEIVRILPCPQRSHLWWNSHARNSREAQASTFAFPEYPNMSSPSTDLARCSVATLKINLLVLYCMQCRCA